MKATLAQALSAKITARANCIKSGNLNWLGNHEHDIDMLIKRLPSGGGIDFGTSVNYNKTNINKIVLKSALHVMNDNGYYLSIVDYQVVITPSLQFDFKIRIIGNFGTNPDANGLKEYLIDIYDYALRKEVTI